MTLLKITKLWIPLALTWLMMSAEGPFLAAIVARMSEPKYNLAAFGIAFAFALLTEAPIMMLLGASTVLSKDRKSYFKLRNFTFTLNLIITIILLLIALPPIFKIIAVDMIGVEPNIAQIANNAVLLLLPWPASIGFRRFYHGILIRNNQTVKIAITTISRILIMATTAISLYKLSYLKGAYIASIALSSAVLFESLFTRWIARKNISSLLNQKVTEDIKTPTYLEITKFYYPLALTPFIAISAQPIITFFLAKSVYSLESLAIFPVVASFSFIFRSMGLSLHEIAIAKIGNNFENYSQIKLFSIILASVITIVNVLVIFTFLGDIWFVDISGLSEFLAGFAIIGSRIIFILPALTVLISIQRAILITASQTTPVGISTVIELVGIIITIYLFVKLTSIPGIYAACFSFLVGRVAANIFLIYPINKIFKNRTC